MHSRLQGPDPREEESHAGQKVSVVDGQAALDLDPDQTGPLLVLSLQDRCSSTAWFSTRLNDSRKEKFRARVPGLLQGAGSEQGIQGLRAWEQGSNRKGVPLWRKLNSDQED